MILFWRIFDIPLFKESQTDDPILTGQTNSWDIDIFSWNTPDVQPITWWAFSWFQNWDDLDLEISDIDKVYSILENGNPWIDFSVISPKPQNITYSDQVEEAFKYYLSNNLNSLTIPSNVRWWWMYIKLHKPLKYLPSIPAYQPITLKTNIYNENSRLIYWRLDTSSSLPTYEENQEFLYNLTDVPVRVDKQPSTYDWLQKKWQQVIIGWFVSDTSWNYIEKIVFIWQK